VSRLSRRRPLRRLLVLQPYLPAYRVPLFQALVDLLPDVVVVVAHGAPSAGLRARGDASGGQPWARPVPTLEVGVPRTSARLVAKRQVGRWARQADIVVAELSVVSLNSWWLALTRSRSLVLWGHGDSFVRAGGSLRGRLEARLARRAAQVWTYSEAGRQSLLRRGVPADRVRTIGNSTDTRTLRALQQAGGPDVAALVRDHGLTPGYTAVFVGGLDPDKRIDFLLAAAAHAHDREPGFRLLVAGDGAEADGVRAAARSTPHVRHLGRADAAALAALGTVADAVWMPGRVGLVAVDCLALGVPVLTTDFAHHAPEIDYLAEGTDRYTLPDDPARFAEQALTLMQSSKTGRDSATPVPSVEQVAGRMAAGLLDLPLTRRSGPHPS
jgi:glycosyltransferase involved in cell wall biosynthesis